MTSKPDGRRASRQTPERTAASSVGCGGRLRQHLVDMSGSSVASFLATATDGLVFWFLVGSGVIVVQHSWWVGVAAFGGACVGGVIHYSLSRFWVFRRFGAPIVGSAFLYFAMSWSAALLHGWLTVMLADVVGAGWAWFASKGLLWFAWTYPLSRWLVFGSWLGGGERD